MRSLATTLLLLLLPGLLLPAGLLLHICRCAETLSTPPAHDCCAPAATAVAAVDGGSCCGHGTAASAPTEPQPVEPPPDRPPAARARDCGCVWVPLADDQPEPARPDPSPVALVEPPAPGALVLPTPPAPVRPHAVHSAYGRPPPDHQRSLPLRL
jgi:hypothetical protein